MFVRPSLDLYSLAEYRNNPMYRFEERDGKKYLIVEERVDS